jgi:large subunit ribosomal protein L16
MLMPKRVKYRKTHRGRRQGPANRGNVISFGEYGLVAEESAWIDSKQIEAARRAITHFTKRGGQIWIRVFPDKSVTAKPAETRMGSGKGAPDHWVAVVKPGRILFELGDVREDVAKMALRRAAFKLPIPTRFVTKAETLGEEAEVEEGAEVAAEVATETEGGEE